MQEKSENDMKKSVSSEETSVQELADELAAEAIVADEIASDAALTDDLVADIADAAQADAEVAAEAALADEAPELPDPDETAAVLSEAGVAVPENPDAVAESEVSADSETDNEITEKESDAKPSPTHEEITRYRNILEGVLLVSGEAVTANHLAKLFDPPLTTKFVNSLLNDLKEQWKNREVELVSVASGWRFQGSPEVRRHMERLSAEKPPRYSRAVMETLAIIAYRQPVTRGEIEAIRGVAVSTNIVKALEDRQWIEAVGHKETPGRPSLYATTKKFLDDLGLRSLAELPPLAELDSSHLLEMPDAPTKSAETPLTLASPIITENHDDVAVVVSEPEIEPGDAGLRGHDTHENQENL
jgi:segregation and condensation protein B